MELTSHRLSKGGQAVEALAHALALLKLPQSVPLVMRELIDLTRSDIVAIGRQHISSEAGQPGNVWIYHLSLSQTFARRTET